MNPIEYRIDLDCRRAESQVIITAKQGEASGRKITFSLKEGRLPYKVPSGVTAVLRAKKPSGAVLYNTCTVTADGKVEYIITTQTVADVGTLPCELQLSQDGRVIFSPNFTLLVYRNLAIDSEVESSDEYTALQTALTRAENVTDGTTFTPSVSSDGVLSWTNDGGKTNPAPVSIKGSKGETGADGIGIQSVEQTTASTEDGGTNVITVAKTDGTSFTFTVKNGTKGSTGATGAAGKDGYTPVRGTDYWTEADIATIQSYVNEKAAALQSKSITDSGGHFTTDTVEGALQEIGAELAGINTLLGSGLQINFNIEDAHCTAISGQTFYEWIGSGYKYLDNGMVLSVGGSGEGVVFLDEAGVFAASLDGNTPVYGSDKIISGGAYISMSYGG